LRNRFISIQEKVSETHVEKRKNLKKLVPGGMSVSSALIATKLLNFHLHEVAVVWELCDIDCEARVDFMNWYLHAVRDREIGPTRVLFNGEACFHLSGYMNSHNNRCELAVNRMLIHDVPLHDKKVGVWCAMGANRNIGVYFL
jgi:hypothetical protein